MNTVQFLVACAMIGFGVGLQFCWYFANNWRSLRRETYFKDTAEMARRMESGNTIAAVAGLMLIISGVVLGLVGVV